MTDQFLPQSINGSPAPAGLLIQNPVTAIANGSTDTAVLRFDDADVTSTGAVSAVSTAGTGTIFEIDEPGLWAILVTSADAAGVPAAITVNEAATPAITAVPTDFSAATTVAIGEFGTSPTTLATMFRVTSADLDATTGVASVRILAVGAALVEAETRVSIQRVSL